MELKKTVWFNSMNYTGQVCTDLQIMVVYPPFYIIMFFLMENLTIAIGLYGCEWNIHWFMVWIVAHQLDATFHLGTVYILHRQVFVAVDAK